MKDANFQDAVTSMYLSFQAKQYTAIPCIVVQVNNGLKTQSVDVQPAINIKLRNGVVKEQPVILSVPVIFPASRTSSFTFPLNTGDTVWCMFSQRGMDVFKSLDGRPAAASDFRKFDKRDAVALPGLFPFSKAINDQSKRTWPHNTADAVVAHNLGTGSEVEIRWKENGNLVINTKQDVEINCTNAKVTATQNTSINTATFDVTANTATFNIGNTTWAGNITHNGNTTQTGNYTQTGIYMLGVVNMNTHVHPGVVSGPSTTAGPV